MAEKLGKLLPWLGSARRLTLLILVVGVLVLILSGKEVPSNVYSILGIVITAFFVSDKPKTNGQDGEPTK